MQASDFWYILRYLKFDTNKISLLAKFKKTFVEYIFVVRYNLLGKYNQGAV